MCFADFLAGAAAQSVSVDGKLKSGKKGQDSDRMGTGLGEVSEDAKSTKSGEGNPNGTHGESQEEEADEENMAEGLEAEEGDFVNVEVAFAYRARTTGAKELSKKSKNAHLFLAFYLPGSIRFRKSSKHSYFLLRPSSLLHLWRPPHQFVIRTEPLSARERHGQ